MIHADKNKFDGEIKIISVGKRCKFEWHELHMKGELWNNE